MVNVAYKSTVYFLCSVCCRLYNHFYYFLYRNVHLNIRVYLTRSWSLLKYLLINLFIFTDHITKKLYDYCFNAASYNLVLFNLLENSSDRS